MSTAHGKFVFCLFVRVRVYVGQMEWQSGRVQPGGGVSRDALHHQQRGSHLSQCTPRQRDTGPGTNARSSSTATISTDKMTYYMFMVSVHPAEF